MTKFCIILSGNKAVHITACLHKKEGMGKILPQSEMPNILCIII